MHIFLLPEKVNFERAMGVSLDYYARAFGNLNAILNTTEKSEDSASFLVLGKAIPPH